METTNVKIIFEQLKTERNIVMNYLRSMEVSLKNNLLNLKNFQYQYDTNSKTLLMKAERLLFEKKTLPEVIPETVPVLLQDPIPRQEVTNPTCFSSNDSDYGSESNDLGIDLDRPIKKELTMDDVVELQSKYTEYSNDIYNQGEQAITEELTMDDVMKVLLIFASVLALSCAQNQAVPRALLTEFLDFAQVIPFRQIMDITNNHLENDPGFGAGIKYLQSAAWEDLQNKIMQSQEYKDLKKRLLYLGIPVDFLHTFMKNLVRNAKPGVIGDEINFEPYFNDIEAVLPVDKIFGMIRDKIQNNAAFRELFEKVQSKETFKLVERLRALPESKLLYSQLIKMGVKVDEYLIIIYGFLDWGSP
ncbi:unnamed protein product [Brassicogethes aeneus]|uniref:Uncharacterized protein n=1 Tax=Brassicogethes aeneus TaxID=1431903 RepID=A0A9P0APU4_BRAAE|nr:unnamed protein product [Brassicogethes aeneus]